MARRKRPLFARWYPDAAARLEERGLAAQRAELLAPLEGRVLEIGCGFGANFPHYPDAVTELVAVEPEEHFRDLARARADELGLKATIVEGAAEALPVESGSFDAVVATAVLCSVDSQADALAEIARVLKPGGELRGFEHVGSPGRARHAAEKVLDAVLWTHLNGGCRLSRDTLGAIRAAGFDTGGMREERFAFLPFPVSKSPHIVGTARKPG
ncbi:class I SAM-dependent methyltransferase [Glycomyces luteolus]|uniref:Class I SAM-dependent methyltransferase n=1 Tax=Glycomyces luteolus TaxID=2670330 RepID=A0A9X3PB35_9ACTN|nr:class I SAM-dependent methyltransferase [Glycomyces luteolus]MDA1360060.1 class I SAM-dependent methyltransferase [Glycomyces luteolus]